MEAVDYSGQLLAGKLPGGLFVHQRASVPDGNFYRTVALVDGQIQAHLRDMIC